MSVTAGVSDTIISIREKLRGKIGQTKVKRYWSGKAPEWAEYKEEVEEDVTMHKVVVLDWKDDPRLRRLAQARTEDREQVIADHMRIRQAEIVSTEQEEDETRDDEEENEEIRRRRIKEANLEREQEEDVEDEDEDEDEYETDDDSEDEEEMHVINMIKPFYVLKDARDTVAERKRLEAEVEAFEELAKRKLEIRKIETKQIVAEELRKDEEILKNMLVLEDVETDDENNEAEEYEVWRTREMARIKRERDAREAMLRVSLGETKPKLLIVMENIFFNRTLTEQYDLKGKTQGRLTLNRAETLLDQNFVNQMHSSPLRAQNTMDYSLLVGVEKKNNEVVCAIIDYLAPYSLMKKVESETKTAK
ncbi:microfibrillar-associated protein 1A-like [Capsella rubella]|uniref:microfibrillar-associated protein 1A-like n=1 Tax=Capsella rubella TaxID=81985 RepID=UPI000CD57088|nr:microfibrillar-associated protein 1A-like [Capsella rubella]